MNTTGERAKQGGGGGDRIGLLTAYHQRTTTAYDFFSATSDAPIKLIRGFYLCYQPFLNSPEEKQNKKTMGKLELLLFI